MPIPANAVSVLASDVKLDTLCCCGGAVADGVGTGSGAGAAGGSDDIFFLILFLNKSIESFFFSFKFQFSFICLFCHCCEALYGKWALLVMR